LEKIQQKNIFEVDIEGAIVVPGTPYNHEAYTTQIKRASTKNKNVNG